MFAPIPGKTADPSSDIGTLVSQRDFVMLTDYMLNSLEINTGSR